MTTMMMLVKDNRKIGAYKQSVFQIRGIKTSDISNASKYLKMNVSFINKVLSLIEKNPELDDEEIAEMLFDLEN